MKELKPDRSVRLATLLRVAAINLCMTLSLLSGTGMALADSRVALVVGNSAYTETAALTNPVNDAADVAAALERLGFEVFLGTDLDEDGFAERLGAFSARLHTADVALFYYAGHGLQFDGQNYLVPVDARLNDQFGVRRETIPLDEIMAEMSEAAVSLVFVDACRNNPFADQLKRSLSRSRAASVGRGLARVDTAGGDMLVAFAAAPGEVADDGRGRNSPFTKAILNHIETPGIEISTMLKRVTHEVRTETRGDQQPQQLTSMATEFYMLPPPGAVVPDPTPGPDGPGDGEQFAFSAALSINTRVAWTAFLADFPDGRYRALAEAALEKLAIEEAALAEPVAGDEPVITAEPENAGEIAELLSTASDAYAARRYEEAVAAYRAAVDLGDVTAMGDLAYLTAAGRGTARDIPRAVTLYKDSIAGGNMIAAYNYGWMIERGDGVARDPAEAARLILDSLAGGNAETRAALRTQLFEDVSLLGSDTRRALQQSLRDRGHYDGSIDGSIGPASRAAIDRLVDPGP